MSGEYPETIMLSPECLHGRPLGQIPYTDGFVFTTRDDQFVLGVEEGGRDVVEVSSTRIDFPSFRLTHPPDLDLAVIGRRDYQGERGVECRKVDTTVMPFKDVFDCREIVESIESARCAIWCVLAKPRNIPYAHGLVLGCGHNQVFLGMKLS